MIAAKDIAGHADLAEAAYVDFGIVSIGGLSGDDLAAKFASAKSKDGWPKERRDDFVTHWRVAAHQPDTASGFSATLFQRVSPQPGEQEYVVAMRGTAGVFSDLLGTDLADLVANGLAWEQIIDMYNWWQRISTPVGQPLDQVGSVPIDFKLGVGRAVAGYSDVVIEAGVAHQLLHNYTIQTALPLISKATAVDVTGHSLGGHLATAFSRIFYGQTGEVLSVNGAGYSILGVPSGNITRVFTELGGYTNAFDESKIVNIYGDKGPNFITQNLSAGLRQPGYQLPVFLENTSIDNTVGHGSGQMAHSANIYETYRQLEGDSAPTNPAKMLSRYRPLLEAASNEADLSFERSIDGLRRLVLGNTEAPTTNLETLFKRMEELQEHQAFKDLQGKVLVSRSDTSLASKAKDDFGAMATLLALSPVAITANGTANLTTVETRLGKNDFSSALSQWKVDKDLSKEAKAAGQQTYTDRWMQDRAAMAGWVAKRNEKDVATATSGGVITGQSDVAAAYYTDVKTSTTVAIGAVLPNLRKQVYFGNDNDNTVDGFGKDDALYGGAGDDTLKGQGGNDYLEGNEGADSLEGGDGSDVLLGGESNDTLNGGMGADILKGGEGVDIYKFESGFGKDTIIDAGGKGKIEVVGVGNGKLDGSNAKAVAGKEGSWQSSDLKVSYNVVNLGSSQSAFPTGLLITFADKPNDTILIEGWSSSKNLGISFDATPEAPKPDLATHIGDYQKEIEQGQGVDAGKQYYFVEEGVSGFKLTGQAQIDAPDHLVGEYDKPNHLEGRGGSDAVVGRGLDDYVDGGDGDDYVSGGGGRDTLMGGAGNDVILGSFDAYTSITSIGQGGSNGGGGHQINTNFDINTKIPADAYNIIKGFNWAVYREPKPGSTESYLVLKGLRPGLNVDSLVFDGKGKFIDAGSGKDFVIAGTANDTVYGGDGDDQIFGFDADDVVFGDKGDDTLRGDGSAFFGYPVEYRNNYYNHSPAASHGEDVLSGGEGDDFIQGDGASDVLFGGDGNDRLWGDTAGAAGATDDLPTFYQGDDYLDGGAGNDQGVGGAGKDLLLGGEGNDQLYGDDWDLERLPGQYHNKDYLDGEDGDDALRGGGNDDVLIGGAGNDALYGDASEAGMKAQDSGQDELDGGAGDDHLIGGAKNDVLMGGEDNDLLEGDGSFVNLADHGDDMLDGGSGNDALKGNGGKDTLRGGEGNDLLEGGDGNDLLDGGAGADILKGGLGDDVYVFDSLDTLSDSQFADGVDDIEGANTIIFEAATPFNVRVTQSTNQPNAVAIVAGDESNVLFLVNGAAGVNNTVVLGDQANGGEALTMNQLIGRYGDTGGGSSAGGGASGVFSGMGADGRLFLMGGATADVVDGSGRGNTTFSGGRGDDIITGTGVSGAYGGLVYLYERGDGADTVLDGALSRGGYEPGFASRIVFGEGIAATDISFVLNEQQHLVIEVGGAQPGRITLPAFSAGSSTPEPPSGIFQFFDGSELKLADLLATLGVKTAGTDASELIAGTWQDETFSASAGDDTLRGNSGSDIYEWGLGSGQDTVLEQGSGAADVDVLRFTGALMPADLLFIRRGNDLEVRSKTSADVLLVLGQFRADQSQGVEKVNFGSGALVWNRTDLLSNLSLPPMTEGADNFPGTPGDDSVMGLGGNDSLFGLGGNDQLDGGQGDDSLEGGEGADTLLGGLGQDWLLGGAGNDQATGGEGNDTLVGEDGDDQLEGGAGKDRLVGFDGNDTLSGGSGDDLLLGLAGNDLLIGGDGYDDVSGGAGDDTLVYSGSGSDTLRGDDGSDTYRFLAWPNAGAPTFVFENVNSVGVDTVELPADTTLANIYLSRVENHANGVDKLAIFRSAGGAAGISLEGYFWDAADNSGVEFIKLGDGTVLSRQQVLGMTQGLPVATAGNDNLVGYRFDDSVDGGQGDDSIDGRAGNDTLLGGGGNDDLLGNAGDDALLGGEGQDTLLGGLGNDTLNGGFGDDVLNGEAGNDNYVFGRQSGKDMMSGLAPGAGEINRLVIDADVSASELTFHRDLNNLVIQINGTSAQMTVGGYFKVFNNQGALLPGANSSGYFGGLQEIVLSQTGSVWGPVDIANKVTLPSTSIVTVNGVDTLLTSQSAGLAADIENITGTGGLNIRLVGNTGHNVITGNAGNNSLNGFKELNEPGAFVNWTAGGPPQNDFSVSNGLTQGNGTKGADTMRGGAGDDTYFVNGGANTNAGYVEYLPVNGDDLVLELPGEGIDTVVTDNYFETLTPDVENLIALNQYGYSQSGQPIAHVYKGNELNNRIDATRTKFTVRIDGGAGADSMFGNAAESTMYGVDNLGDVVTELTSGGLLPTFPNGLDRVEASISYALGSEIEDLTLVADAAINGTGNASANNIKGNGANNVLDGLAGNDTLDGGLGNDTYLFGKGDGWDTILEANLDGNTSKLNVLKLKPGVASSDVVLRRLGADLEVAVGSAADTVLVKSFFETAATPNLSANSPIQRIELSNGISWDGAAIISKLQSNNAPVLAQAVPDFGFKQGEVSYYTVPLTTFTDSDTGDALTYSASLANGQALPSWVYFDSSERKFSFSGYDTQTISGTFGLKVTATDKAGASASDVFDVTVQTENRTIVGTAGNDGYYILQGFSGNDTIEGGLGNDYMDGGLGNDVYVYGAGDGRDVIREYLADSAPDKLNILRFKANVAPNQVAVRQVGNNLEVVVASEANKITLESFFLEGSSSNAANPIQRIEFLADGSAWDLAAIQSKLGGNASPTVNAALADQSALQGVLVSYTVPANSFTDADAGNVLTYTATQANGATLPSWLSFNAATRTFNGTAPTDSVSITTIKVTATDAAGASASDVFDWTVASENKTLTGTGAADVLVGYSGNDSLSGAAGNDSLSGNAGGDVFDGGAGADVIDGGSGNDVVLFGMGDGQDVMQEAIADSAAGKLNTLRFKSGVLASQVSVNRVGADLEVLIAGGSDKVTVKSFFASTGPLAGTNPLQRIEFADNTVWDITHIQTLVNAPVNTAPAVNTPLSDQSVQQGAAVNYTVPVSSFVDADAGDVLNYSATLADGAALPSWLSFNTSTRTFTGTAPSTLGGTSIKVVATDSAGASASDVFDLTVAAVDNTLPTKNLVGTSGNDSLFGDTGNDMLDGGIGNDTYYFGRDQGQDQIRDLDWSANTDVLKFLSGVQAEQLWFRSTGNDLEISIIGTTDKVTVRDWYQGEVYWVEQFRTADGRTLNAQNVNVMVNAMASMAPPPLGETTLSASQLAALAPVFAANWSGGSVTPPPINNVPVLNTPLADQSSSQGTSVSYTIPTGTFTDTDAGDVLAYGATLSNGSALPSWLSFNASNRTFTGTAPTDSVGTTSIKVTATDAAGASANDVFDWAIASENKTLVGAGSADVLVGYSGNDSLSGAAGNDSLSGNGGNDVLNGGADADVIDGGSGNDVVLFGLGDGQDVMQEATADSAAGKLNILRIKSGVLPSQVSVNRVGADLEVLIAGGSDKVTVKSFFAGTGPLAATNPLQRIEFADGGSWDIAQIQALVTSPVNTAPVVNTPLADQSVQQGGAVNYTVPVSSFTDADAGDVLSYSATLASGDALPSWLSFNASTRTFAGTAPNTLGATRIKVVATDGAGVTASDVFDLTVTAADNTLPAKNLVGTPGNDTLFGDNGNNVLDGGTGNDTYFFGRGQGQDQIRDLEWSANTDVLKFLSGVQAEQLWFRSTGNDLEISIIGTTDRVTVRDWYQGEVYWVEQFKTADGRTLTAQNVNALVSAMARMPPPLGQTSLSASQQAALAPVFAANWSGTSVTPPTNTAPVLNAPLADQSTLQGVALSYTISANAFTDADAADVLSYSATQTNGAALPSWLIFNGNARHFSGTAPTDTLHSISIKVTATDVGGASVSDVFSWAVAAENKTLTGTSADDLLVGYSGSDSLSGADGEDTLIGNAGDDVLHGGEGSDSMTGAAGNDIRHGGAGNDVVLFGNGDGQDTLLEATADAAAGKLNVLRFKSGVAVSDVTVRRVGTDLEMLIGTAADKVTVKGFYTGAGPAASTNPLQQIEFADGTNWDLVKIQSLVVAVEPLPAKNLVGTTGADTMFGDTGNNVLDGGTGNDTYFFGRGQGQDQIRDLEWSANTDMLKFLSGVQVEQLWFKAAGNDLEVSIIGTTDKVTVRDWYQGEVYWVEKFKTADGRTLNAQNVNAMVNAMASMTPPPLGQTTLSTSQQATLEPVFAANWIVTAPTGASTGLETISLELSMQKTSISTISGSELEKTSLPDAEPQSRIFRSEDELGNGSGASHHMPVKTPRLTNSTIKTPWLSGAQDALFETTSEFSLQTWDLPLGDKNGQFAGTPSMLPIKGYFRELSENDLRVLNAGARMESGLNALIDAMAAFAPPAAGEVTLASNEPDGFKQVIAVDWAA